MLKKSDLHEYQNLAIDFLFEHNSALAIMPTGSGKTVTTLTALEELMAEGHIKRPLVIAPIRVAQLVWQAEVDQWSHLSDVDIVYMAGGPKEWDADIPELIDSRVAWGKYQHAASRAKTRDDKDKAELLRKEMLKKARAARKADMPDEIYLSSFENLQWMCDVFKPGEWPFDAIIFDEIGKLKNPTSKRFKALKRHIKAHKDKDRIVWGLTATPAPEGMEDLFTQVYIVDGGERWGRSFYQWRQRHFMQTDFHGYDWMPLIGMREKLFKDIEDISFRIPEEMLTYQKNIVPNHIDVALPEKAMQRYKQMEKEMFLSLDNAMDAELKDIIAMSKAAAAVKCRQIAQGFIYDDERVPTILHEEKAHALADLIDSLHKEPLLVAYEFEEDLVAIQKVWKNIPHIGKGVSKSEAAANRDKWNDGKLPVMAVHPQSAGHGLNLQHGGHNICWYTIIWPLDNYQQTNERIDRQGQKHICYGHHIRALGTSDVRVYDAVTQKGVKQQDVIKAIRSV